MKSEKPSHPSLQHGSDEHAAEALTAEDSRAADERSFVSASSTSLSLRVQGSGYLATRPQPPSVGAVAAAAAAARSVIRDGGAARGPYVVSAHTAPAFSVAVVSFRAVRAVPTVL